MVPRAAQRYVVLACVAAQLCMLPRSSTCAAHQSFVAAQFSILPRTVACGRAVLHVAAHPCCRARSTLHRLRVAAHLYTFPRSSTCCRALGFRARHNASCLRLCCRAVVWIATKGRLVPQSASVARQPWWRLVVVGWSVVRQLRGNWSSSDSVEYSRSTVVVGKKLWL